MLRHRPTRTVIARPRGPRQCAKAYGARKGYPRLAAFRAALAGTLTLALLGTPTTARAARSREASEIINACTHDRSLAGFSQQAYSQALEQMLTYTREYTPCEEEILKAREAAALNGNRVPGAGAVPSGSGGPGSGGAEGAGGLGFASIPPTPTEQETMRHSAEAPPGAIVEGADSVTPGVVPVDIASVVHALPVPLLALLALLAAMALAGAGGATTRALGKGQAARSARARGGAPGEAASRWAGAKNHAGTAIGLVRPSPLSILRGLLARMHR
jgi:hypothetical protein